MVSLFAYLIKTKRLFDNHIDLLMDVNYAFKQDFWVFILEHLF